MTYPLCPRLPCVSPANVEWGTVAEWATVVVALLALAAAAVTAWFASTASVAARRQADAAERTFAEDARTRAEAQPRKVYAIEFRRSKSAIGDPVMSLFQGSRAPEFVDDRTMWDIVEGEHVFTEMVLHVGIEVCNLSDEVIGRVVLTLVDPMSGMRSATRHAVTVIMPGQSRDFEMLIEIPEGWDPSLQADDIMPALQPLLEFRDSGGQWWSRQGTDPIERLKRGVHELP